MAATPFPAVIQQSPSRYSAYDNTTHLSSPLSSLPKCSSLKELKQIQAFTIKTHLQNDLQILTKLINFCTQKPNTSAMDYAHQLFETIPQPDIVLFNSIFRGYSRSNAPLRAIYLFIKALNENILPDDYTFPSLLKACAVAKALQQGKQLHCLAVKLGLNENTFVCPTLINMYTGCNDVDGARRVFDKILEPCVVSYNAIITGYARSSRPNEALSLFRQLQARKLKPNDVTMLSVLSSCALLGALDLGKWIHEYVKKNGLGKYVKVNTALIDMYAKCGSLDDAISVFESMSVRDTQAWSAMVVAYATHGQGQKAISMFEEMMSTKVQPDEITFLGLLYACSHTGLVDEGFRYFYSMSDVYGIIPGIKHYGCMVDLLGRAGRLDEAYKFIDELPIKPTPILWRTLLSACTSHGNLELAKQVMEQIFELDDSHGGDYVILSNLCARAGKWEDVDALRKRMIHKGAVKVPGCSSIEVDNVVHEFFSGDGVHYISTALHRAMDELVKELKLAGYVPDTSLVVHPNMEDEEKEITLRYHSEKLAIAFGLLNTPQGQQSVCDFIISKTGNALVGITGSIVCLIEIPPQLIESSALVPVSQQMFLSAMIRGLCSWYFLSVSQDFDFFYFVQQWPGSYCDSKQSCCYPTTGKPAADFGIHGLWPNYNDGTYPQNCDANKPFDPKEVADLRSSMQKNWPTLACPSGSGVTFWTHEWEKHGTCSESNLDQHGYFQAALNLKKQANLLQALTTAGINPDGGLYSLSSIKSAIQKAVGFTPWIECNTDTSRNSQLYQIYLCVDTSGKNLIECPVFPKGKCDSEIEFPTF
ncbi:unnamed protein product [Dovyalis caffra]|uniref:DYW domain-containing protein n=1 Tax=Dovyalis caffra TaxID=77055 RepID=A0AAV1QYF4_9ROSI|nr:unnamed protein product [Dovyalis caffra]